MAEKKSQQRLTEELKGIIQRLKKMDLSMDEISDIIGVSRQTLYRWKAKDETIAKIFSEKKQPIIIYDAKKHPQIVGYLKRLGYTIEEIISELKISKQTYYDWNKKHEEFSNACNIGKTLFLNDIANGLYKRAQGYQTEEVKITYTYEMDASGDYIEIPVKKEVYGKHIPSDIKATIKVLEQGDPDKWTKKGQELILALKTGVKDNPELNDMKERLNRSDPEILELVGKHIESAPPQIVQKYILNGEVEPLLNYIIGENN